MATKYLIPHEQVARLNDQLWKIALPAVQSTIARQVILTRQSEPMIAARRALDAGRVDWNAVGQLGSIDLFNPTANDMAGYYTTATLAWLRASGVVAKGSNWQDVDMRRLAEMVRQNTESWQTGTRNAVINAMTSAVRNDMTMSELVDVLVRTVGLDERYARAVDNFQNGLIERGTSRSAARGRAKQYANTLVRARAKTIARTETQRMLQLAQREAYERTMDLLGIPASAATVEWLTSDDEKLCEQCAPLNGETAPFDNTVWDNGDTYTYGPPLHPNCRCTTVVRFEMP